MDHPLLNKGLGLQDILLIPQYSNIKRENVDTKPHAWHNLNMSIPIISAPMDTITDYVMLREMTDLGGTGIHHRYCDISILLDVSKRFNGCIPIAVGSLPSHKNEIDQLINIGHKIFAVDIAHGYTEKGIDTIKYIRKCVPDSDIISGNVCTGEAAANLCACGANIIRAGVGAGSACGTRIITGCGRSTVDTILDIVEALESSTVLRLDPYPHILLDGGITSSADMIKALALGVDCVIIGGMFAGTNETPGPHFIKRTNRCNNLEEYILSTVEDLMSGGRLYKQYRGMASESALLEGNRKDPKYLHVEGIDTFVKSKGPVKYVVDQLVTSLKQAMFYLGTNDLNELMSECEFGLANATTQNEGKPHIHEM
jgi:IMP dehydrogenase